MKFELACQTNPKWVQGILKNFDKFLIDHADCERKASAMALNIVVKCPEKTHFIEPLISLALEELTHFKQVYQIMQKRGLSLNHQMSEDHYVNQLLDLCRHGKEDRLLDRMIVLSLVEARGAERFGIVADALSDSTLKKFYRKLHLAEKKHGAIFVRLASKYYPKDTIQNRLRKLISEEARIVDSLPWRASIH